MLQADSDEIVILKQNYLGRSMAGRGNSWTISRPNPSASVRLFCFPFAGGSANYFHQWAIALEPHVEVCALSLPGRGARIKEAPYQHMQQVIAELEVSTPGLLDKPAIFFGHSMGAWVAYELSSRLKVQPAHLIVSAADPGLRRKVAPVHLMNDKDLIEELKVLGGTPDEILENLEFFSQFFPMIRADFKMLETHCMLSRMPLPIGASIWSGARDPRVSPALAYGWTHKFCSEVKHNTFRGGHMFINPDESGPACLTEIQRIVSTLALSEKDSPVAFTQ